MTIEEMQRLEALWVAKCNRDGGPLLRMTQDGPEIYLGEPEAAEMRERWRGAGWGPWRSLYVDAEDRARNVAVLAIMERDGEFGEPDHECDESVIDDTCDACGQRHCPKCPC